MKKVVIYTTADKRPDFIELQHSTLKKHVQDSYEFVVLNNAIDSRSRRKEISSTCQKLGIKCVQVKRDKKYGVIGDTKVFTWRGAFRNANVGTAYPLKWAWETICEENKDNLVVIIDSDMFLSQDISFNRELGEKQASFMIQYRGPKNHRKDADVSYIWNGICIFNVSEIKKLKELNWDCGTVNGFAVDVGGFSHFWDEKKTLTVQHISEYAIHNFAIKSENLIWLEATINGNYHYSFEYDTQTREVTLFHCYETGWQKGDAILPHLQNDFENILTLKTIKYFEEYILNKQTYPSPTFLGFIEFETFNETISPFIIHHKAGSGYVGFDEEYRKKKLNFIKNICK